jgi:hypothetical protein
MRVPVGCGASLDESIMLKTDEYENALNWIYDRSLEGKLHLKATCAPHYFRVMRQRAKASGAAMPQHAHPHKNMGAHGNGHGHAAPSGHGAQADMSAMTKGCLAGQAVCFVSHTGEVFPCGYLPVSSGNVTKIPFPTIWRESTVFADLRTNVLNYSDRGLVGMALDPSFPTKPYVYVMYTYDAQIGGTAPQWGVAGQTADSCPTPDTGCLASGRLSRLQASGDQMVGSEQVLVEDWCQQFNHSVGMVTFGPDGSLYASAGDGATYQSPDWGQTGNACGDPPGPAGTISFRLSRA